MRPYLITIVERDGSCGHYRALFKSDWDALDAVMDPFFTARRITARRLA